MHETALPRLLDSALLTRVFPERPVPAPVPQAGIMLDALARRPPQARAVMVLRDCADLSMEQVTDVLGCAAGYVNRHNAYALATLRAVLGEALADPSSASGPGENIPSQGKSRDG
jgi:DNA-directed RNA polymerase specialized sigma24 family protein